MRLASTTWRATYGNGWGIASPTTTEGAPTDGSAWMSGDCHRHIVPRGFLETAVRGCFALQAAAELEPIAGPPLSAFGSPGRLVLDEHQMTLPDFYDGGFAKIHCDEER